MNGSVWSQCQQPRDRGTIYVCTVLRNFSNVPSETDTLLSIDPQIFSVNFDSIDTEPFENENHFFLVTVTRTRVCRKEQQFINKVKYSLLLCSYYKILGAIPARFARKFLSSLASSLHPPSTPSLHLKHCIEKGFLVVAMGIK